MTTKQHTPFSLRDRAMLVELHMSKWEGKRLDRQTTDEVLEEKGAERDAGEFTTKLLPKEAMAEVQTCLSRARATHCRMSLPWDEAVGIIPATRWDSYSEEMERRRADFFKAVEAFLAAYPGYVEEARARLGKLHDPADFPTVPAMRGKFDFRVTVLPVPDKGDFRIDLGDEATAAIRKGIEEHVVNRFQEAQRDLWTRLLDTLRHFTVTMKADGKTFRDATVEKLATMADEARDLSLAPDPQLDHICGEFHKMAKTYRPDLVRADPKVRKAAAQDAAAMVARIEKMMDGAF